MSNKKSGDVPPSGHTIPMPNVKPPADMSDLKQARKLLRALLKVAKARSELCTAYRVGSHASHAHADRVLTKLEQLKKVESDVRAFLARSGKRFRSKFAETK
jgi:hypothetical protein